MNQLHRSRGAGLSRLAGLSGELAEAGERMAEKRGRFAALADPGAAPAVVSSFNLFQTPEPIAERMAIEADIRPGARVLEPSAGLGRLIRAALTAEPTAIVDAAEISDEVADQLQRQGIAASIYRGDFLRLSPDLVNPFDRVIMNPPFRMGADVEHIIHAMKFLKPGGRLVALCADGPRQNARLRPIVEEKGGTWETLPAGSFRSEGTSVSVALLTLDA